jgi:hypothetical protein
MAQATDTRTTSRDRVTPVAAFSLSHKFEEHCAKYGRVARFNHMERIRAVFDCVGRR